MGRTQSGSWLPTIQQVSSAPLYAHNPWTFQVINQLISHKCTSISLQITEKTKESTDILNSYHNLQNSSFKITLISQNLKCAI